MLLVLKEQLSKKFNPVIIYSLSFQTYETFCASVKQKLAGLSMLFNANKAFNYQKGIQVQCKYHKSSVICILGV